jgi:hypothetical protein
MVHCGRRVKRGTLVWFEILFSFSQAKAFFRGFRLSALGDSTVEKIQVVYWSNRHFNSYSLTFHTNAIIESNYFCFVRFGIEFSESP